MVVVGTPDTNAHLAKPRAMVVSTESTYAAAAASRVIAADEIAATQAMNRDGQDVQKFVAALRLIPWIRNPREETRHAARTDLHHASWKPGKQI